MSMCDVCSTHISEESTFFESNRVLTNPSYWKIYISNPICSEETLGMFVTMMSKDTGGFTVCSDCRSKLQDDLSYIKQLGLEEYVESLPSKKVDVNKVRVVAGTVFKQIHGRWPNSIPNMDKSASNCFIATAIYGENSYEVELLRYFRDNYLMNHRIGKSFTVVYYNIAPSVSKLIKKFKLIAIPVEKIISYIIIPPVKNKINKENIKK